MKKDKINNMKIITKGSFDTENEYGLDILAEMFEYAKEKGMTREELKDIIDRSLKEIRDEYKPGDVTTSLESGFKEVKEHKEGKKKLKSLKEAKKLWKQWSKGNRDKIIRIAKENTKYNEQGYAVYLKMMSGEKITNGIEVGMRKSLIKNNH
ncbi:hypothetical protein FKF97_10880 [Clostridium perfringens]|nr:hypothetical protein [Clostridium perfringens]